jgi:hypothetical protein
MAGAALAMSHSGARLARTARFLACATVSGHHPFRHYRGMAAVINTLVRCALAIASWAGEVPFSAGAIIEMIGTHG